MNGKPRQTNLAVIGRQLASIRRRHFENSLRGRFARRQFSVKLPRARCSRPAPARRQKFETESGSAPRQKFDPASVKFHTAAPSFCFSSHGAKPRTAVKLTNGCVNRVCRHPPLFQRQIQRLRQNQFAVKPQNFHRCPTTSISIFGKSNFCSGGKDLRETRPVQIRAQPMICPQ